LARIDEVAVGGPEICDNFLTRTTLNAAARI
jgi:hypothetical protein